MLLCNLLLYINYWCINENYMYKITLLYICISMYIYNILYEHGRKAILTKNKCWMHLGTKFIL